MPAYSNSGGRSDITSYTEPDADSVIVEFRGGGVRCLYSFSISGAAVYRLKTLLRSGSGARAYINRSGLSYQRV